MNALATLTALAALTCMPSALPLPVSHTGDLHHANTKDKIDFSRDIGDTIDFYVEANGTGSNKMRVRLQQKSTTSGSWNTVRDFDLDMGDSRAGRYKVQNSGPIPYVSRDLRFLLSRNIGTQRVDWELRYWP